MTLLSNCKVVTLQQTAYKPPAVKVHMNLSQPIVLNEIKVSDALNGLLDSLSAKDEPAFPTMAYVPQKMSVRILVRSYSMALHHTLYIHGPPRALATEPMWRKSIFCGRMVNGQRVLS